MPFSVKPFRISLKNMAKISIIGLFFSLFGGSCSRWNLGDVGPNTKVFRSIHAADGIRIGQQFDVFLMQDTTQAEGYWIEFPEKLIPQIEHHLNDNEWQIRDENRGKWTQDLNRKPKITLNFHRYHKLIIDGSSTWKCLDTLLAPELNIDMNSVMNHDIWVNCNELTGRCQNLGSLNLSGKGTILSFSVESGSQLNALSLRCHDAYFWHFTQKDCYLAPEKQAELYLFNSGNVLLPNRDFYRLQTNTKGKGRVIFLP